MQNNHSCFIRYYAAECEWVFYLFPIRSISNVPIIFVTSCNTDMDELNSIPLGGDAFITKPYHTAILLAKITSLLRRAYASGQAETWTWGGATLHLESSMIEYQGQRAELTKNELKFFIISFRTLV